MQIKVYMSKTLYMNAVYTYKENNICSFPIARINGPCILPPVICVASL